MQLYYQLIEQLDLAAEQLQRDGANYGRFALILADNAIELMVHHKCQNIVMWDEVGPEVVPPRLDAKVRKEAKGTRLRPKVDLCLAESALSKDERDWILICHKYRNTLYHEGIAYESFCHDLAWHYHEVACSLLPRFAGQLWWCSTDRVSDAVQRHTSDEGLRSFDAQGHLAEVVESLGDCRPTQQRSLSEALSSASLDRLESTAASLDFVARDNPNGLGKQQIVVNIQFHHHLRSIDFPKSLTHEDFPAFIEEKRKNWAPEYRQNPLPAWLRRARTLKEAASEIRALRRFDRLLRDSRHFERLVNDAAVSLDAYISEQIDLARGK